MREIAKTKTYTAFPNAANADLLSAAAIQSEPTLYPTESLSRAHDLAVASFLLLNNKPQATGDPSGTSWNKPTERPCDHHDTFTVRLSTDASTVLTGSHLQAVERCLRLGNDLVRASRSSFCTFRLYRKNTPHPRNRGCQLNRTGRCCSTSTQRQCSPGQSHAGK